MNTHHRDINAFTKAVSLNHRQTHPTPFDAWLQVSKRHTRLTSLAKELYVGMAQYHPPVAVRIPSTDERAKTPSMATSMPPNACADTLTAALTEPPTYKSLFEALQGYVCKG